VRGEPEGDLQVFAPRQLTTAETVTVKAASSCWSSTYCPEGKTEFLANDFHLDGIMDSFRRRRGHYYWQTSTTTNGGANWLELELSDYFKINGLWLRMSSCYGSGPQDVTIQSKGLHGSWVDETSITRTASTSATLIPTSFVATEVRLYISSWYLYGCASSDTLRLYSIQFDYSYRCPAGAFLNVTTLACDACPPGTNSYEGNAHVCLPLVGHALKKTQLPEVSSVGSSDSLLHISVHLSELPIVYEGALDYFIDMAPTAGELSEDSDCMQVWENTSVGFRATFRYDELNESCRLNVTQDVTSIIRRGVLGIFVMLSPVNITDDQVVVGQWLYTIPVIYPKSIVATKSVSEVWTPLWNSSLLPTHPGNFPASLHFYQTHLFQLKKDYLVYHDGDDAWIRIQLDQEHFDMSVKYVLLSTSYDARDESAVVHNLTAQERQRASGRVDFQVRLQRCAACFLHVWAEVYLRRLTSSGAREVHYAYKFAAVVVEDVDAGAGDTVTVTVTVPSGADTADADIEAAAPLVMPLGVAVPGMMAISLFSGVLSYFALVRGARAGTTDEQARFRILFVVIEFLDVGVDWLAFVLCRAEGDLNLEDNGVIEVALGLSVILSTFLFFGEGFLAVTAPAKMNKVVPALICIHFMGEDAFQLLLYAYAQACQAASGLGSSPSLMFSMCQAFLFVTGKLLALMFEQRRVPAFIGVPTEI